MLMVLFGLAGVTILVLAWLWPMPGLERAMSIGAGVFGLCIALGQVALLKSAKADVKVEAQDKP
jgi:hypothetical protein